MSDFGRRSSTQQRRVDPTHASAIGRISRIARRLPLVTFALITMAVSWPLGLLPPGPSIAAILTAAIIGGRSEVGTLLRRVTVWRVGWRWYAIALAGPVILVASAGWLTSITVADSTGVHPADWWGYFGLLGVQLFGVFAGPWEELGWRGFALPRLLERWDALTASLVLGLGWAVWHLPMLLSGDLPWPDVAVILAVTVPFTAMFLHTRGSVLLAFIMHGSLNAAGGVVIPAFDGAARNRAYWFMAGLAAVLSVVLVALWPRFRPTVADPGLPAPAAGTLHSKA